MSEGKGADPDEDLRWMDAALNLGSRSLGLTAPNPAVGAILVKDGAVVIDVGVNRIGMTPEGKAKLAGDVDFDAVKEKASAITPVPGGVGPMTITMLMLNTVKAAKVAAGV